MNERGADARRTAPVDLAAVLAGAVLLAAVAVAPADATPLRAAIGLPLLLLVPGYALLAAAFPAGDAVDDDHPWIARLALVPAAGVMAVAAVSLSLEFTVWGFQPLPLVAGICVLTLVATAVAWLRRRRLGVAGPRVSGATLRRQITGGTTLSLLLTVVVVATSVGAVAVVTTEHTETPPVTELYLLGETGDEDQSLAAGAHPTNLTAGEPATYVLGAGTDGEPLSGTVVARLERVDDTGGTIGASRQVGRFPVDLAAGESTTIRHTVEPTLTGEDLRLTYRLYRGEPGEATVVREVHVRVSVADRGKGQ